MAVQFFDVKSLARLKETASEAAEREARAISARRTGVPDVFDQLCIYDRANFEE